MKTDKPSKDLLWKNISSLPYFRGFLRAVEGGYYEDIELREPVLDLGCGDGHFSSVTFGEGTHRLVGIDPDLRSLLEASQYTVFSKLVCAHGDKLPFSARYFKTTVSNSVLEHIPDVDSVLKEANRVLQTNANLVICVPNDNFTRNLSIARFFDGIGLSPLARVYRKFFNTISRHFHPDPSEIWRERLQNAGFAIDRSWNYFTQQSLAILEWGHYFGLPSWINKMIFGRWILFPTYKNPLLIRTYRWLKKHTEKDQKLSEGAYSFFIATRE